jgi:tRNA nucleotidyltransferase (CCA-adding enzyme)
MHIILTHEQADFDALGALLGASLRNVKAIPILPNRTNRNVRAFLTLYGAELPFVEMQDLPSEPIESVTLVDTQSLVSLKGMGKKTPVYVIDHHQQRRDLPHHWIVKMETIGACTTLFVEDMRDHNGPLNHIQATLLLLGIYEDTGSLSYVSTTSRDIQAAAFLLDQGASLRIANRYLNPSLSIGQRRLYDRLLDTAQSHTINGRQVVITAANGEDVNEEISSIAHKLRDLLDPEALLLVVKTSEGIRLIARSTCDEIDVAGVMSKFGGGGHARAASALIDSSKDPLIKTRPVDDSLAEVSSKLLEIMHSSVSPSITVGQIMSKRPHMLTSQTPAEEAVVQMQRYGYEGFPVVDNGRVVGLLTRRAVDRALSHKLNLPAASLMEAGEIVVLPHEPIEALQELMAASGWGQVPVIDPISKKVIGIVTRTDLLRTLTRGESHRPAKKNLAKLLENQLSPTRLALLKAIAAEAHEMRAPLYIVGGFVRDLLLKRPGQDFDIVVEGDAIALGRRLCDDFGGRIVSHRRFGTAKWQIGEIRKELAARLSEGHPLDPDDLPESPDLISARTEFYEYPTALPTVERSNIKLDLHRRDFTINTMALRLDGSHYGDLYDYWGGLVDLQDRLVRVLHSLSFVDDPTRLLRAVRFEQRFGFSIESRTLQLMIEANTIVRQVSGDRIRHELDLILSEKQAEAMLARLNELGIFNAIHPDFRWPEENAASFQRLLSSVPLPDWGCPDRIGSLPVRKALFYTLWLASLPETVSLEIADRLRLPSQVQTAVLSAFALRKNIVSYTKLPPSEVCAALDHYPITSLFVHCLITPPAEQRKLIETYAEKWRLVQPHTSGHTLEEMGIRPGPAYRRILDELRKGWLDGTIQSVEDEQAVLHRIR